MSQEYSCADLLRLAKPEKQLTEAEKTEGMEKLKAAAKKYAAYKALTAAWQTDIGGIRRRTMTEQIDNFTLCKQVVMEHSIAAPVVEPTQTEAEKNAKFLAKVAEGDRICWNSQIEKAKDMAATNQYPFQSRTFEPSHTFQPQLSQSSWMHSDEPW